MPFTSQPAPLPRQTPPSGNSLPFWLPPLFFLILAALFLWRSLFGGEVFLPAGLLGYIAPYSTQIHPGSLPPWNALRWDGIAQFYPWRHFASASLHSGTIPLWNPYQFCGTPFVANSQSAVFYPGNLLFYLLPTAQAFGFSAWLHLTLCGWFMYLLLRRLGHSGAASLLGGTVFAYSAWQVAWLQLPTFLATSCWIPLLLRQIYIVGKRKSAAGPTSLPFHLFPLPCILGLMLLAGHLQIAFYGLLAGTLWAVGLLVVRGRRLGAAACMRTLAVYGVGLILGLMLAAPQLLPTLELSRRSHRAGAPTWSGYRLYTAYALPRANLVTLILPDFFGNDDDPQNPYWGFYVTTLPGGQPISVRHNAAETALYVGIVPLLLGSLALGRGVRSRFRDRGLLFFACLAILALLLALGTGLDALFYFGLPGFGQSGSPARALVLWALAWAALASYGLDTLRARPPTKRETTGLVGGLALLLVIGLGLAARALVSPPQHAEALQIPNLGDALSRIGVDWLRLAAWTAGGLALLLPAARRSLLRRAAAGPALDTDAVSAAAEERQLPIFVLGALLLVVLDLFTAGLFSNPTSPPAWVYPETGGIRYLRARLGHERIFPINWRWDLLKPPPAILPPNGAMAYGLRDVEGYDSLLTGRFKAFADKLARPRPDGSRDASPPEVGNMVFAQNAQAPLAPLTGAVYVLTLPTDAPEFSASLPPSGTPLYAEPGEMTIYRMPGALPRVRLVAGKGEAAGSIAWIEDGPTRVALDVDTPVPATLILADQIYPGWRVTIDSQPASMTSQMPEAAGIFRAVSIPAGHHRVAFIYEPNSFRLGLYLACLACLVLSILISASRASSSSYSLGLTISHK